MALPFRPPSQVLTEVRGLSQDIFRPGWLVRADVAETL